MAHAIELLAFITLALATADIQMPPTIVEQFRKYHSIFKPGGRLELPCVALGTPRPEYEWLKNGDILDRNDPNVLLSNVDGTLTIPAATSLHEGYYQCRASNSHGTALTNVIFLQEAVLEHENVEITRYLGRVGAPLRVPCLGLRSLPEPTVTWKVAQTLAEGNQLAVTLSPRVTVDVNGNLYFAYLTEEDQRDGYLYKCNAFNPVKDSTQGGSYARIEVDTNNAVNEALPELMYSTPSPHVVLERQAEARLKCFFSGRPAPRVSWQRVGKPLPVGRHTTEVYGTELVIRNVQADDEGEYICFGMNDLTDGRSEEVHIFLDVQAKPLFEPEWKPANMNASEGDERATFFCRTTAEPKAHVQWLINGEPLNLSDLGPRMSLSYDGHSLSFHNLCKTCANGDSDLRVIQCNASNVHGYAFASAYLNVLERTLITSVPEEVLYEEGLPEVRFDCEATSDDSTPVEISWLKDDSTIYPATDARINITDSNTLVIDLTGMSEDDIGAKYHGEYTCFASNSYTFSTEVVQFEVKRSERLAGILSGSLFWILIVVVLSLLVLILLLCCCLWCQRNKEKVYNVEEEERAIGRDPAREHVDNGFHVAQVLHREEMPQVTRGRASLSSLQQPDIWGDTSFAVDGDLDTSGYDEEVKPKRLHWEEASLGSTPSKSRWRQL